MLSYSVFGFYSDNPDFELAALVADGAVQTAAKPSWRGPEHCEQSLSSTIAIASAVKALLFDYTLAR